MNYNYLVIEGSIGAGKTSLARMIADKYKARLILEQFADNPFLPKFYGNPERYSFPLELSFLASRYQQVNKELTNRDLFSPFTVADYHFTKSLIFAQTTLQKDEYTLFRQLFDIIIQQLPKPDLYVYLYLPVNQLLRNISGRGRDYEKNIQAEYLEKIQDGYLNYLKVIDDMRILIIDRSHIDFVNDPDDFKKLENKIFYGKWNYGINRLLIP